MKYESGLFVACPAADDPLNDVIEDPHVTLSFFGPVEVIEDRYGPDALMGLLDVGERIAARHRPFEVKVNGKGQLGDEGAQILLVESKELVDLYLELVFPDVVHQLIADFPDKHPWWIPHMTYSYDSEGSAVDVPEAVQLTRLGLWWADDREYWDLTGPDRDLDRYLGMVPVVDNPDDLLAAVTVADANPEARWYVERRAKALGMDHVLPDWGAR